jgi:uncharacterized alpha-E superfamily protein
MLLSRVADSLYWISRYLERAEHTARLIDVRLDPASTGAAARMGGTSIGWRGAAAGAARRRRRARPAALVDALMFDLSNGDSVLSSVIAARENARQVREEISSEMWEQVNAPSCASAAHRDGPRWPGRITCRAR